jgi:hypothetical protein
LNLSTSASYPGSVFLERWEKEQMAKASHQ